MLIFIPEISWTSSGSKLIQDLLFCQLQNSDLLPPRGWSSNKSVNAWCSSAEIWTISSRDLPRTPYPHPQQNNCHHRIKQIGRILTLFSPQYYVGMICRSRTTDGLVIVSVIGKHDCKLNAICLIATSTVKQSAMKEIGRHRHSVRLPWLYLSVAGFF